MLRTEPLSPTGGRAVCGWRGSWDAAMGTVRKGNGYERITSFVVPRRGAQEGFAVSQAGRCTAEAAVRDRPADWLATLHAMRMCTVAERENNAVERQWKVKGRQLWVTERQWRGKEMQWKVSEISSGKVRNNPVEGQVVKAVRKVKQRQ